MQHFTTTKKDSPNQHQQNHVYTYLKRAHKGQKNVQANTHTHNENI